MLKIQVVFLYSNLINQEVSKIWANRQPYRIRPDGEKIIRIVKTYGVALEPPLDKVPIVECVVEDEVIKNDIKILPGKYVTDDCWITIEEKHPDIPMYMNEDPKVIYQIKGHSNSLEKMERMIRYIINEQMQPITKY